MTKRVLDVGNCVPDHAAVRRLVESNFDAEVSQSHQLRDTLAALRKERFDLVIVNRKLDHDYSDGLEIIRKIKADPELRQVPAIMLSNYPEYQKEAIEAGAEMGFGKQEYGKPATLEQLGKFLGDEPS